MLGQHSRERVQDKSIQKKHYEQLLKLQNIFTNPSLFLISAYEKEIQITKEKEQPALTGLKLSLVALSPGTSIGRFRCGGSA